MRSMPASARLARSLYRGVLRCYPASEWHHGTREMAELFEDLFLEARARGGRFTAWRLALRAAAEAVACGLRARRARGAGSRRRHRSDRHLERQQGGEQGGVGDSSDAGHGDGRRHGGGDDGGAGRGSRYRRRPAVIANVLQDARYALRTFGANPGVTFVAIAIFALGIGANTAVFSVVEAALLRSLPYADPERLVDVNELPAMVFDRGEPRAGGGVVMLSTYRAWRQQARVFEEMAVYTSTQPVLTGLGEPVEVFAFPVESNLFELLGARPLIGRGFRPDEDRPGAPRIVVLSHAFWSTRLGRDPGVVGRTLSLDGEPYEIVGVMPRGFRFPVFMASADREAAAVWVPFGPRVEALERSTGGQGSCWVVGRLRAGVTAAAAKADLDRVLDGVQRVARRADWRANVTPLHSWVSGEVRQPLLLLLGAVALVLLVACSNVANLLLARAVSRRQEMTIRMAVGASRGRLMGQVLVESGLLALAGGLLGIVLAHRTIPLVLSLSEGLIPRINDVGINASVLGTTLAATFLAATLTGCVPALGAARRARAGSLLVSSHGAGEGRHLGRATGAFVVAQVALTLVLLAGAGLLVRSLIGLLRVETGFETEQVLVAEIELPGWLYQEPEQRLDYARRVLEGVRTTPGVTDAAASSFAPFENGIISSVEVADRPERTGLPWATVVASTRDFFQVAGIPLRRGRLFDDGPATGRFAVIDEAAAETYFPGEDPLGRPLATYRWREGPLTVIGVVGNVREDSLREDAPPHVYVPLAASPEYYLRVLARTVGDTGAVARSVRKTVREVDPLVPIERVVPLRAVVTESLQRERFYTLLLGSFAAVAILMAGAGIFGVMRYAVSRRTRELGVRMALGARDRDILAMVVGRGLGLAALGIVLGILGAAATTRLLSSFLYGLSPYDPLTFVAAAIALAGLAAAASVVPAWRATHVDPVRSLRAE